MRAVRVFGCIAVGVVHTVEYGICARRKVRRTLADPGKYVKKSLPVFVHQKHLMGGVSVEKETLTKEREIPMKEK